MEKGFESIIFEPSFVEGNVYPKHVGQANVKASAKREKLNKGLKMMEKTCSQCKCNLGIDKNAESLVVEGLVADLDGCVRVLEVMYNYVVGECIEFANGVKLAFLRKRTNAELLALN